MADNNNQIRDDDKRDAQEFASFIKHAKSESTFSYFVASAVSSYLRGFVDACNLIKAPSQHA